MFGRHGRRGPRSARRSSPLIWFSHSRCSVERALEYKRGFARRLAVETLEDRRMLTVALSGVPSWIPQGPGPILDGQVRNVPAASPLGDNPVVGAIHTILAHPTNSDILYVGAVNGGIWKTINATSAAEPTWQPLTDQFASLSIGAMTFDLADATSNTIVAGIGRFSSFFGTGGLQTGLLKTTNGGVSWTQLGQNDLAGRNISGVYANGNTIVVSANGGAGGVWRSTNGGTTFTLISGTNGLSAGGAFDLVFDPTATNRLYTTISGVGLFRSNDSGLNWTNVSQNDPAALVPAFTGGGNNNAEMAISPTTGRIYTAVLQSGRVVYIGFSDSQGGAWTQMDLPVSLETTVPITNATNATPIVITSANHGLNNGQRVRISGVLGNTAANGDFTITKVDPDGAGPLTTNDGFSLDGSAGNGAYGGGGNWQLLLELNPEEEEEEEGGDEPGGQGATHFSIAVDPANANIVYVGGDRQDQAPNAIGAVTSSGRLFRGNTAVAAVSPGNPSNVFSPQWQHLTDNQNAGFIGGGTANQSAPHADSREMAFMANGQLLESDDGGIYRRSSPTNNTGDWFSMMGNLQVTEIHDVAYDPISNIILAGDQDTGSPEQTSSGSAVWRSISTADGGDVAVDALIGGNQSVRYSSTQNLGTFRRRVFNSANAQVGATQTPSLTVGGGGAAIVKQFVTPVVTNLVAANRLIIGGSNSTYESTDRGDNVTEIGPGIGVNGSNGAVAYGGMMGGAANPDVLYVGSGSQIFLRTTAGGALAATAALPGAGSITAIAMNPMNWMTAYATDGARVYQTTNAGGAWTNVSGDLTDTLLQSLQVITNGVVDAILVGGRMGVQRMLSNALGMWSEFGAGLPNAPVSELAYNAGDDVLVVGTLGRGAWEVTNATAAALTKGVLTLTGDTDFPNEDDVFRLVRDANNPLLLHYFINGAEGVGSPISMDSVQQINVDGLGGNDTLIVDSTNGLISVDMGIRYNGGNGFDTLRLDQTGGTTQVSDVLSIGATNGSGVSTITGPGTGGAQTVSFEALEPVLDVVPAATFNVNATPGIASLLQDANTINYQVGQTLGPTAGRITVDAFEPIEFSNKAQMTLDAGAGADDIHLNNGSLPVAMTSLTVNGGDGDDTVTVTALNAGLTSVMLTGDAGNDVIDATPLTQAVPLALGGGVGNDTITGGPGADTITAGTGDDTIFWSAGTDGIDGGNAGAGDTLIFRGNAAANALAIQQLAAANMISVTLDAQTGTDTLTSLESIRVELLDNNDAFTIDLPNAQLITAAPLFYDGGAGRDTLTVQGTFGGGNGVDRVTYSPGLQPDEGRLLYEEGLVLGQTMDVKFDNLEPLFDLVAAAMLTVEGTSGSNAIAYRQGSAANRGLVTVDSFESIEFSGKTNVTINGNAGDDRIVADNASTPTGLASITFNADAGNDEVRIENLPAAITVLVNDAARAGSGDGNDVIDVSQNPNATATTLNGGAGIDTIIGGLGIDAINAGSGNDIIVSSPVPAASTDTIDGGTGEDQFNIIGRILNDTITAVQASATALNVSYNGVARNNTLATAGGIPTIEKVFIDGGSGDDLMAISVADVAVLADAASLPFDVVGNSPNASDRLVVNDDGTGDLVINRQGPDGRSGSVAVGGKPPVTYTTVERIDITPLVVLPPPTPALTPGTGVTANGGRVITFKYDDFESNDTITDATALGADPIFINQRNIDPGGVILGPPFGTIPGDADWYEFRPDRIGSFRFDILFEHIPAVPSGRMGLPGNGDLRLDIFRADGTLIASSNSSAATSLNVDTQESIGISTTTNTSYFVRVSGATAAAINTYTLTVSNADEVGPQVFDPDDAGPLAAIFPNNLNTYNLFNRKPDVDGPTPLIFSLTINVRDLPVRFPGDLYSALDAIASSNPGLFTVTGDHVGLVDIRNIAVVNEPQANYAFNGIVTVASNASMFTVGPLGQVPRIGDNITFTSGPAANETRQITAFNPATGLIVVNAPFSAAPAATNAFLITSFPEAQIILTFAKPLPEDRFTLRILDGVVDPAGNALDGESNAAEPNNPMFPSGNGISGGDFVARFTVDSRPELGAAVGGDIDLDTNGNFVWDPANSQIGNDATNVDLSFTLLVQNGVNGPLAPGGFNVNDLMFGGKFTNPPAGGVLPPRLFDQLAAFGFAGDLAAPGFRWLIDTTGDGVITVGTTDLLRLQATTAYPANLNPFNVSGAIPIAGNFDGNAANGDEIGLYSGGRWALDANRSFNIDANDAFISTNMMGAPIVGDFDGNGQDDLAVFNNNVFYFALNPAFVNSSIVYNSALTVTWGFAGTLDKPVATDMDGDGVDDIGLWEPRTSASLPREVSEWYFLVSGARLGTVVVPPAAPAPTVNTFFAPALGASAIAAGTLIRVTGANGVTQHGQVQAYNTATGQLTVTGLTTAPAVGDIVSVGGIGNTLTLLNHAFNTAPFGNDIVAEFGDEQALPILGNFDPPATPTVVLPPQSTTTADVTHDGRIDGADFLSWQRSLGTTGTAAAAGDTDGNSVVNYSDLTKWKQQFGATTTTSAQTAAATGATTAALTTAESADGELLDVEPQAPAGQDGAALVGVAQTVQSKAEAAAPNSGTSQVVDHSAYDVAFTRWRRMTTLTVGELTKGSDEPRSVEQHVAAVDHVLSEPAGRRVRPLVGSGRLMSGLRLW